MVVPKSSPFNNVKELIDYAKKNPGVLNVASSGVGTSVHLSAELFKQLAGVDVTHVPYKGTGTAMPDLLRSEEHTSELQSLMRISYAVFCLKKNNYIFIKQLPTHNYATYAFKMIITN